MGRTAGNNVGGVRLVGYYSLKGERTNLSSAIFLFEKVDDSAHGVQKKYFFY